MATNDEAHLRGAGFVNKSTPGQRGDQPLVSPRVNTFATGSFDPVIGAQSIAEVWRALGGGELRRGRGRAFWREGDGFNVALDSKRGIWRDFATNEGGGILRLVETVRGCSKGEAFRWLADLAGVGLAPFSPDRRRRYAQTRRDAAEIAKLAAWWLESRCEELEELKRLSNGDYGTWDEAALAAASGGLFRLHQMDPAEVIAEFSKACQIESERTRELIQAGRTHQEQLDEIISRILRTPETRR